MSDTPPSNSVYPSAGSANPMPPAQPMPAAGQPVVDGGPTPQGWAAAPPPPNAPMAVVPTRTGPVITLVVGIALAIVVAPLIAMTGLGSAVQDMSSMQVGNVDETSLFSADAGEQYSIYSEGEAMACEVTDMQGASIAQGSTDPSTASYQEVTSFQVDTDQGVQIMCSSDTAYTFLVGPGLDSSMTSSFLLGFGGATIAGLAGLVMTIIGIVWLVKRNKAIRQATMGY